MTAFSAMAVRRRAAQQGFALPLALVAIASLAIITLVGYRAVSGATEIVTAIQDDVRIEQAFHSAEAEAAFTFLTATAANGGVVTNADAAPVADPEIDNTDTDADAPEPRAFWRADGEQRVSAAAPEPIVVAYYDAAGFAPISALPEELLAQFLTAAGFERDPATEMAARIADYQDDDVRRRFRGAERTEYRLFAAAPPTNSPLRTVGELASVLEYADQAPAESWDFMLENARFGGLSSQFKPLLGPASVAGLFQTDAEASFATNPTESYVQLDTQPTDTARFLLAHGAATGLTRRRAVEIMRTAGAADKPFRRVWIYDKAEHGNGPATAAIEQRDMASVFQPAPDADSR